VSDVRNFFQGASNSAASSVGVPVDAIAWLLRKAGAGGLIGNAPVGGSDWLRQKGLTAEAPGLAGLLGESVGGVAPMLAAAKAPQIAGGLLQAGDNLTNAPRMFPGPGNSQRGAVDLGVRYKLEKLPRDMREELFNEHAMNLNPTATERGFYSKSVPHGTMSLEGVVIDKIPAEQLTRYADVKKLPPIVIADGRLIDGQHRIAAARAQGVHSLPYIDMTGLIDTNAGGFISELPKLAK
jgi:hypothetical protein